MADTEAERIQSEYLGRLRRTLRNAPAQVGEDAIREVQSHIEDEWHALGGDTPSLRTVLERLGAPEEYGRDLALQLMLNRPSGGNRLIMLGWATLFWASTSLLGSIVALCGGLMFGFGLGMVFVAIERLLGNHTWLINSVGLEVFGWRAERVLFPPDSWPPALVAVAGLIPTIVFFALIYSLLSAWLHSRLALRGLAVNVQAPAGAVPAARRERAAHDLEHRAILPMVLFAILGLVSCIVFTILSEMITIGRYTHLSLPADFFRTPLTFLTLVGALIFLASPALGLWWATRSDRG